MTSDPHTDDVFKERHELLAVIADLRAQLAERDQLDAVALTEEKERLHAALALARKRAQQLSDTMTRTVIEYTELLSEAGTRIVLIGPEADEHQERIGP